MWDFRRLISEVLVTPRAHGRWLERPAAEFMSTHVFGRRTQPRVAVRLGLSGHWAWLTGGFVVAFALPFLLADVLEINRDLFYGLYATAVLGLIGLWARATRYDSSPQSSGGGRGQSHSARSSLA